MACQAEYQQLKGEVMAKPTSSQMKEFWSQVDAGRITKVVFQKFLTDLNPKEEMKFETFTVTVDHSMSLDQMITAGKYDWVNEKISSDFIVTGYRQVEIEILFVHFNRWATTKDVEAELEKRGLRAATIEELLVLGAMHPDLQRKFPVIALGSRCSLNGGGGVPVLHGYGNERALNLYYYDGEWSDRYRFAAVRK